MAYNLLQWLKSVTGFSAATAITDHLQRVGTPPGWPILVENLDEWDMRAILDGAHIESWAYFPQPGPIPGTVTVAMWCTVSRDSAYDAEAALVRHGAIIGARSLFADDGVMA